MSKPTKKPCSSWTGSNFYQKSRFRYIPRSSSLLQTPSVLRVQYVPHSIRQSNSYGPRTQKYDEYINIFDISDDSDDISGRKKYPSGLHSPSMPYTQSVRIKKSNSNEKTTLGPTKAPSTPIIHCYNTQTRTKDQLSNSQLNIKKSASIRNKKISFVLPGCKKPSNSERMNWKDFHKLNVIYQFMDDLETNYPSICTTAVIGKSVEGRDLKILKISNSNASNVAVWIDSGIHAREWIAPAVNTYIANHIITNFDNLPESVRNKDWYFLPIVNPDGYHYSHSIDRMWRKNRALHNGLPSGVDLNRNFCLGWGRRGSSENPRNAFYRGPHPFSEPESRAMRDMLVNSGINFKVYLTLHCYGQIIIFPYSFSTELAPDYISLLEGATTMAKAIYNTNGSTYKVGVSKDVMYGASGTSNDFAHGYAGIPYCYVIELRSKKYKFRLPKEQIEETGQEILNSVLALVEYIDNYQYQDRVDQNIDSLLENDSFINNNSINIDSYVRKKHSDYKKSKYKQQKISSNDIQGSFITHNSGERNDSRGETSDTGWSDSLENVTLLNNKDTSKTPAMIARSSNTQYPSDHYDSKTQSDLENNYAWRKNTDPYKKVDGNLPDSFNNGNESVLKKSTSEKETNPYKKVNQCLRNFFDDEKEFHRNKTNTSEKVTDPYKKENQYYPDSIDSRKESDLLQDDVRYVSKQETVPYKKVAQYVPDSSNIETESDLKMDYPSKKEINQVKKGKKESFKKVAQYLPDSCDGEKESNQNIIDALENETNLLEKELNQVKKLNENLPDFLFAKSDLKKIGTSEKGTNLNNKINQHLSDSFNIEKESQLKKIDTSKGKKESIEKVIQPLPDFFDGERKSNLNIIDALENETNTLEKELNQLKKINEYLPDSLFAKSDLKKIDTSEKGTNLNNKINQHLSDSFNTEKESQLKKIDTSKGKKELSKKVIPHLPDFFDGERKSNLNIIDALENETNTSEKELNQVKKINEYLPDSLFAKSDLKKIGTSEKGTNLNSKINQHLSDSFYTEKESQLKKIDTSKGKKELFKKVIPHLPDFFDGERKSNLNIIDALENETNTSEKDLNQVKKNNEYLPDSLFAKSDLKKIGTSEKGTNLNSKINQHLSDSFNIDKESQLKKIDTLKGKKESFKKVIPHLPGFYNGERKSNLNIYNTSESETNTSEKDINRKKKINEYLSDFLFVKSNLKNIGTTTSEKGTKPNNKINHYLSDSFNTEKESQLKKIDTSKGKKESFKKVIPHLPGFYNGERKSNLNIYNTSESETNTSEKEINRKKKINEYLPDFLFVKSNLKNIGTTTSEKGTKPNNKINHYLSDSFNTEKESQLKKINTSKGKKTSFKKVAQYLPDSCDGEKESNLNKINALEKETNTSEKDYWSGSDDYLFFHPDSFLIKAESIRALSDANECCVDSKPFETNSFPVKEDSFEEWNSFYEQKRNFDMMRSSLLSKTDDTFILNDIQWYLYFDIL